MIISFQIYGQEIENVSYRFLNPNTVDSVSDYRTAFSTADMSAFRFKDKNNVIEFQSGLKVELFSYSFLKDKNLKLDFNKIRKENPINEDYIFEISKNGKYILQKYTRTEFKSRNHINN